MVRCALLWLLTLGVVSRVDAQEPVKVFILAGQSNMEGKGFPEPLAYQVTRPEFRQRYERFVKNGDFDSFTNTLEVSIERDPKRPHYDWSVRGDVWINYLGKHGDLSVGYATPAKCFGPEFLFGHTLGDHFDEQVLLIKTAWGGKSLGRDFLSPSSKLPTDAEFEAMAAQRNAQIAQRNDKQRAEHAKRGSNRPFEPKPSVTAAELKDQYGHFYREMMREVRDTLANLGERFPSYRGQGYELAGFVWFQGWNDQFNDEWAASYGAHLANLIRDVRRDLDAPKLPVVIGVVGFDGGRPQKPRKDGEPTARSLIIRGQSEVAGEPEFRGNVRAVETAKYWDMEADAIYRGPGGWKADPAKWRRFGNDRPYHYYGSPWFFAQAGQGFGEAMVELVQQR